MTGLPIDTQIVQAEFDVSIYCVVRDVVIEQLNKRTVYLFYLVIALRVVEQCSLFIYVQ